MHPNHHPDIRWVMAITAGVTALMVGGLLFLDARASNPERVLMQETSPNRKAAATIDELQRRIAGLQTVVNNLQLELKTKQDDPLAVSAAASASLPAPAVLPSTPVAFSSRHGFGFVYPATWKVLDNHVESYPNLVEAQAAGGNYITLAATGDKSENDPTGYTAQVTLWVLDHDVPKNVTQWITASAPRGAKVESFLMAGQPAKRVRAINTDKTPSLLYYQVTGNKAVLGRVLPAQPTALIDIETILMSFSWSKTT